MNGSRWRFKYFYKVSFNYRNCPGVFKERIALSCLDMILDRIEASPLFPMEETEPVKVKAFLPDVPSAARYLKNFRLSEFFDGMIFGPGVAALPDGKSVGSKVQFLMEFDWTCIRKEWTPRDMERLCNYFIGTFEYDPLVRYDKKLTLDRWFYAGPPSQPLVDEYLTSAWIWLDSETLLSGPTGRWKPGAWIRAMTDNYYGSQRNFPSLMCVMLDDPKKISELRETKFWKAGIDECNDASAKEIENDWKSGTFRAG